MLILILVVVLLTGAFALSMALLLAMIFLRSVRCRFLCCVHHFLWFFLTPPKSNSIPFISQSHLLSLLFYQRDVTEMCNLIFREQASWTARDAAGRRLFFFLSWRGCDVIFFVMYCTFCFVMFCLSSYSCTFLRFRWRSWGQFKEEKKEKWPLLFLSLFFFLVPRQHPTPHTLHPNSYVTLRWRAES